MKTPEPTNTQTKKDRNERLEKLLMSFDYDRIAQAMQAGDKTTWEAIANRMVDHLFDDSKLMMISRLDKTLMYYMLKHQILLRMYQRYWETVSVIPSMSSHDEYPYYKITMTVDRAKIKEYMRMAYEDVVKDMYRITISQDGKGRTESFETMKTAETRTLEQSLNEMKSRASRFFDSSI